MRKRGITMPELFQAGKRTYYINCYANVGVYVCDSGEAYLIDSGTDDKEAQKIYELLEQKRWKLKAVILTHGPCGSCRRLCVSAGNDRVQGLCDGRREDLF